MDALESVKQSLEQVAKSNAEGAVWRAEADAWRKIADKRHAEAEEARKELEAQMAETSKEVKETIRVMREVSRRMGSYDQSQGRLAEEFFQRALERRPRIGDLVFRKVYGNVSPLGKNGARAEYDIVMTSDEYVAVIEVKHKLHRNDVVKVRDALVPSVRHMLPELSDKVLAPGVAGMMADADAVDLAHECGYAVLLPDGQKVRADTEHLRCIPA